MFTFLQTITHSLARAHTHTHRVSPSPFLKHKNENIQN